MHIQALHELHLRTVPVGPLAIGPLATRLIATVRRSSLCRTGSVADQGSLVTRAVDVLMAGVSFAFMHVR